ncbi:MAG: hypothetical protein D6685_01435 [Bacteroidetes bacterium]|nr:MAG: hypothetical protein D6685_01435 [Bacteroidota bacterium]
MKLCTPVGRGRVAALLLVAAIVLPLRAQVPIYDVLYRPPGVDYRVLRSPHFDIIFQVGLEAEAREAAAVLEGTLPGTRDLVGLRRPLRMPVVLNRFNDRSNGYVTPLPFKQEIEGVSLKGKALSPRHASWIEVVAAHELVHAAHAELDPGFGVGRVVRWFAPDVSRSINLSAPSGLTEGVAVYRESRLDGPHAAGRLHFSLFNMAYRAAMLSDDPWSLAQVLERSAYTWPYNRHYIGGAHLYQHLAGEDGGAFFRRATRWYYRFPFLGFGVALWHGAGQSPRRIEQAFRARARAEEQARLAAIGPLTQPHRVAGGTRGVAYRHPVWLDAHTLLVYAYGYALRPGFYRVDVRTGARRLVRAQSNTEEPYFALRPDGRVVAAARYVPDPFSPLRAVSEVEELDLATGRVTRRTSGGRVLAPAYGPGGTLWALQNDGQYNHWVRITPDGGTERLSRREGVLFRSLHPSPDGALVAVVLNVRGTQGIFRARLDAPDGLRLEPWVLFADASVYDAAWSADGRYLVFSADPGGIANLFVLERQTGRVRQVTRAAFGAMEPRPSPDGRQLAYVDYQHERYDLVTIPFEPAAYPPVDPALLRPPEDFAWPPPTVPTPGAAFEVEPYRSWRYAAPRVVYPTLHYTGEPRDRTLDPRLAERFETRLGLGLGFGFQGTDPLQSWRYMGEAFVRNGRPWGRATLELGTSVLRPALTLYDEPETAEVGVTVLSGNGSAVDTSVVGIRMGVEKRGMVLGVRTPITLRSNVFESRLTLGMQGVYEQVRLFNDANETVRGFLGRLTLRPYLIWLHRVQANPRDIVPNSGLVGTLTTELDVWREGGGRRRALIGRLSLYLPLLRAHNIGLRLGGGMLVQNRGSVFDLDAFLPRGYAGRTLGAGTFLRYDAEYTQPLWFIDDGLVLLPAYFQALYGFVFGETLHPAEDPAARLSSVGAGLGLRMRFASLWNLHLRLAASYQLEAGTWDVVLR